MTNKIVTTSLVASATLLLMLSAFATISVAGARHTTASTGTGFPESLSSQYGVFISDIQPTSDGGFIVAGDYRYDSSGFSHALLIKLDSSGNIVWSENYGTNVENTGEDTEFATSVHQTPDGGYVFAGSLETQRNFGTPCYASCAWVVKTDSSGGIQWQSTFSGASTANAVDIELTSDGGYVVTGDTSDSIGIGYAWIAKLGSAGNSQWEERIGCSSTGCDAGIEPIADPSDVQQTADGGYVISGFGGTPDSALVTKLSATGALQWQKNYATMSIILSIQLTSDGGYILTGSGGHSDGYAGWSNLVALKLDQNGNIQWQRQYQDPFLRCAFAGDGCDYVPYSTDGLSVRQTSDGGYIFAGYFTTYAGYYEGWLLKTDTSGNISWQKSYNFTQEFLTVRQTNDGGFVATGSPGHVAKFDSNGNISGCSAIENTSATIVGSSITATALSLPVATLSSAVPITTTASTVTITSTKEC